jgi:hypothetical protein
VNEGYNPAPVQVRSTNGMAIASMVLSIIGVSLLGVIFGHVALGQIKRNNQDGHGMALAGVILGYVGMALYVIMIIALVNAVDDIPTYNYDYTTDLPEMPTFPTEPAQYCDGDICMPIPT